MLKTSMRTILSWCFYILGCPFLALTAVSILLTYACWYPAAFLRNFSNELSESDRISYRKAASLAWRAAQKTPF